MNNDIWPNVQKAREELHVPIEKMSRLMKMQPPGREQLAVAMVQAHLVGAGTALAFREPAVPFHLAFITPPAEATTQNQSRKSDTHIRIPSTQRG